MKKNGIEALLLGLMIAMAIFLRFYQINKLYFFTYDQARDAIYIKRMIIDGELRLLGTQTSMPGMFLPPFYYYTVAPILWLFRLNPIGIDAYAATIGVLTVPLIYLVANRIFSRPAGLFSTSLIAVSPLMVEITRRAWNPNTLPFFILLTFYFLFLFLKKGRRRDFLFASVVYGYCLSLHFGAWTLMPLLLVLWLYLLIKKQQTKTTLFSFLIIFFFVLPLILFEIRHQFFLINQAKTYFLEGQRIGFDFLRVAESWLTSLIALLVIPLAGQASVGHRAPSEFSGRIKDFFTLEEPISVVAQRPFAFSFPWWGTMIVFLILLWSGCFLVRSFKKKSVRSPRLGLLMILTWLFWGLFVSRLYRGGFFFFYYLYLFPIPFLLFGFLGQRLWERKRLRVVLVMAMVGIISFHLAKTTIFGSNWREFKDLRVVARVIANHADEKSFNIVTLRRDQDFWERNSVDYRYFVEAYEKKRVLGWYPEDYQQAEVLFVVDETGKADVLATNVMEILEFNPGEIIGQWEAEKGIVIYQLSKKDEV